MKKFFLFMLLLTLGAMASLQAGNTDITSLDDVVYIEPVSFPAGSQQTLSIKMKNTVGISTVQFDLILPEGVSVVKDEDDFELITLSTERTTTRKMDSFSSQLVSSGAYRVLINSSKMYTFDGNDGEIAQAVIKLDGSMTLGDHPIVITDIELVDAGSHTFFTKRVETTLTVTAQVDNQVILDETSTTVPDASNGEVEVLVRRILKANQWSTICLPFAMTADQVTAAFGTDVAVANFVNYEADYDDADNITAIAVNFNNIDITAGLEANYPYIIKVSKDISEFSLKTTVEPSEVDAVVEYDNGKTGSRRQVYGTFYGVFHAGDVIPSKCLFLSDNKFYYSLGQTKIKAFRGYFDFVDVLTSVDDIANVKFNFFLGEDETRIETLDAQPSIDGTYDLGGRKIEMPQHRGVYIVNGQKVIVK